MKIRITKNIQLNKIIQEELSKVLEERAHSSRLGSGADDFRQLGGDSGYGALLHDPDALNTARSKKAAELLRQMAMTAKNDPALALQTAAELSGFIPVVGNLGDILAMFIAWGRGKPVQAFFSFLAALPAVGLVSRVMSKAFLASGGAKLIAQTDFLTPSAQQAGAQAMADAWRSAWPAIQRTFGTDSLSKIIKRFSDDKVKVLADVDAARKELNKLLKYTPHSKTLSGYINDNFGKVDFLLQITFAGLYIAFGDELATYTGEDRKGIGQYQPPEEDSEYEVVRGIKVMP